MITASNFSNHGRLGNQLFQYASLIGQSKIFNRKLVLPKWRYSEYFSGEFPEGECNEPDFVHNEPVYHYGGDFTLLNRYPNRIVDFKGYWQSELYFKNAKKEVRKALKFKKTFKDQVRQGYDFSKPVIAIHIRRGDYIGHECYFQLPITYFYNALNQWPDWRECNIIIFSDNIKYCKLHFECLENVRFAQGNEIEDMCLASQCQRFILSNSTYAWWCAYLSGSKEIIRPDCLFRGKYKETHNDKDFWIPEWKVLNPEQKINLLDVTFTIPVYYDHPDRKHNLNLCVCLIQHYLDTNVIVMENKHDQFSYFDQWCTYLKCDHKVFHRTKIGRAHV